MSLPPRLLLSFSPAEIEFLAENELIEIEPLHSLPRICLLQSDYGPFDPPRRVMVPLWLALVLKERDMCLIKPPQWMRPDSLLEKCREESGTEVFSKLPLHYLEIASRILHANKEGDTPDATIIKSLLQDLREVRLAKARKGVDYIDNSHIRS